MKVIIVLFVATLNLNLILGRRKFPSYSPGNRYDQYECQTKVCPYGYFNCDCEKSRAEYLNSTKCIPSSWMCDGHSDCADASDEIDCACNSSEMQCSLCAHGGGCSGNLTLDLYQCSSIVKIDDGEPDCLSRKDEYQEQCNQCDGIIDCPHRTPHDESNCTVCPISAPNRCACNNGNPSACKGAGHVCYSDDDRCNGVVDCSDASDELNCPCAENEFMCECYKLNPPRCHGVNRCIPMNKYLNNVTDCPDGSDESQYFREVQCSQCNVKLFRFSDASECDRMGFPTCDNSTCYETPSLKCFGSEDCRMTEVICTSFCPNDTSNECNRGFQCADGSLALISQFCDGKIDCPDNSDEISKQPGFTCEKAGTEQNQARSCVLPQRNLFDFVPHCNDKSDICTGSEANCFQCYDKRLFISSKQLCNGVVDCYDYSDECACENSADISVCKSFSKVNSGSDRCGVIEKKKITTNDNIDPPTPISNENAITCQTKWGSVLAILCDGRPQCPDFRDECFNCPNKPAFCSDANPGGCNSQYRLGDRYCDGVEDDAWKIIDNPTKCPKGFDEKNCPQRFTCKAGHRVSIDVNQVCDGKENCDDGSDEQNCGNSSPRSADKELLSSRGEMIKPSWLQYVIWIMAFIVIFGNLYVIHASAKRMRKKNLTQLVRFQYIIFLNIGIADLIMGWYLFAIAIQSAIFGNSYSTTDDHQWRTSTACSVVGSFVLISSEAACFLMVLLLAFLLYNSMRPSIDGNSKSRKKLLGAGIITAWVAAILLAIVPILNGVSDYFVQNTWMVNPFSDKSVWDFNDAKDFVCRLASLTNTEVQTKDWNSISSFLSNDFPEYSPIGNFGYYSATSLCMPRLFVSYGERSWQYTFIVITANLICYVFISLSYLAATKLQVKEQAEEEEIFDEQEERMQKRIARVVFTNVVAWLIICVLVYIGISGTDMSYTAHVVTAIFLIPINSILNPFLFSALTEKPRSVCCW